MLDFIIVGAGLAGATAARVLTDAGKKVVVVEEREHIAGNCYDFVDEKGVLIHKYGPHIFHTDNKKVVDFLSRFTQWRLYQHKVLGSVDGQLVPIPFNLNSIEKCFSKEIADDIAKKLLLNNEWGKRMPILEMIKEGSPIGKYVYEKVFLGYTTKQWGCTPEEISPEVTGRVPVVISRDDRYFQDKYQMMPLNGYTKMVEAMLEGIPYKTSQEYHIDSTFYDFRDGSTSFALDIPVIYTGPIDKYFDYKYGRLDYRSLKFKFEHDDRQQVQNVGTVNYPNNYDFTRITEFKHLTGQVCNGTTLCYEYPEAYTGENVPYYPMFNDKNRELYERYKKETPLGVYFLGRLAEFKYYDMDDVVERALTLAEGLC